MKRLAIIAFAVVTLVACSKNDDTSGNNNGGGTTGSFTWTENGGGTITADSAYWTTGTWGTGIRAFKAGIVNYFEINWTGQNNVSIGAKTFGNGGSFDFIKSNIFYNVSAGTTPIFNITSFNNNLLSGNFNITTKNSVNAQIILVGAFTSLVKK